MRPMTHGEIRGTILLMLVIAVILAVVSVNRGCSGEAATSAFSSKDSPSAFTIDSLRMEEKAARYDDTTGRKAAHTDDSLSLGERGRKAASGKGRKPAARKRPSSPTPSPLDRPI